MTVRQTASAWTEVGLMYIAVFTGQLVWCGKREHLTVSDSDDNDEGIITDSACV